MFLLHCVDRFKHKKPRTSNENVRIGFCGGKKEDF